MLSLYIITIDDSTGRTQQYRLVSEKQSRAIARAREKAGVPEDAEFRTCQHLQDVDEVLE